MSVQIVQTMIILSFIYALRMKIWNTSLNTFIVISILFILTVSNEIPMLQKIWITYHTSLIGIMIFIIMGRVVFQSVKKKYLEFYCNDCSNYNRRQTDKK